MPHDFTPTGGAYSHGISVQLDDGAVIFTTGQLAIDPQSHVVGIGDVATQTRYVIENVGRILADGGAGLQDIVKGQIFLLDIGDVAAVMTVFDSYLDSVRPVLTVLEVSGLARDDCVVEFEAMAFCTGTHEDATKENAAP
jgi:enamine deaminase RidA (YjgF/YER057c/UK114 family)